MDRGVDTIKFAAAVIIAAMLISLILLISSLLSSTANKATSNTIDIVDSLVNYDIEKYNGETISGNEVIYLLEKLSTSGVYLRVITKGNPSGFTNETAVAGKYNAHAFENVYFKDSTTFINGSGNFKVTLGYDSNDTFYGIMFKQV